jgi:hypothetical protein
LKYVAFVEFEAENDLEAELIALANDWELIDEEIFVLDLDLPTLQ